MKLKKKNLVSGSFILLLIICILFLLNSNQNLKQEKDAFSFALENADSQYSIIKNERIKEKKLYKKLAESNKELLEEVLILRKKKHKIEYITQTKYITETVETIVSVMPDEHLFRTSYNMPICLYEKKSTENHSFKTLPAEYSVNIISSEDTTSVKVKAKSLYDDNVYDIPLENIKTETIRVTPPKEKFFQTELSLGFAVTTEMKLPTSLGVSFMKYKDFNFLKLNVFADENISFGVSPVSWNFASKLAVVQDLSVEAGIESKTTPSFYVGISTKF